MLQAMLRLFLLLAACQGEDPQPKPQPEPSPSVEALVELATEAGFVAQHGAFVRATTAFCCEAVVDCLALDPLDELGTVAVPPAPDQPDLDLDSYWMWGEAPAGLSRDFRLRADEALVWTGTAPPPSAYVGFLAQISTRSADDGTRYRIQGALGPPLRLPQELAGERVTVILTPDRGVDDELRQLLAAADFPLDHVFSVPFSTPLAELGLQPEADSFVASMRVLEAEDSSALERWWSEGEAEVLRFTPQGPEQALSPYPYQPIAARGTGLDESELEDALEELGQGLFESFFGWLPAAGEVSTVWRDPVACLGNLDCDDGWPTRLRSESELLVLDAGAVLLVFGINHTRTGKATASHLSVIGARSDAGTATFDHHQMVGTARPWLGDSPHADDLYAVVFARDCSALPGLPCVEVPEVCPGPAPEAEMYLQFDDWLEPETGSAPHESELTLPRAIKLFPLF
jgi:hypothetical protein